MYSTKIYFVVERSDFPLAELVQVFDAAKAGFQIALLPEWLRTEQPEFFEGCNQPFFLHHEQVNDAFGLRRIIFSQTWVDLSDEIDFIGYVIHTILKHYKSKSCVGFEVIFDCSEPEIESLGGCACFITSHDVEVMSTNEWLHSKKLDYQDKLEDKKYNFS